MNQQSTFNFVSQLARAYILQATGINPADFPQTDDRAWVSLAARHLRTARGRGKAAFRGRHLSVAAK